MKVAIDISPISKDSGHKVRGSGFYVQNLVCEFKKYEDMFFYYTKYKRIPHAVDIIHIPYFDPFFITLPFKKTHKRVVTVHDLTPFVFPKHFPVGARGTLKWHIQKRLLKQSDAIITDSLSSKKDIIRIVDFPEEKIFVIYLAPADHFRKVILSSRQKSEVLKKYSLPEKFILYVGDVTWNKNVPRLVDAIKKTTIPLVMVGKALVSTDYDAKHLWNKDLHQVTMKTVGDKRFIKLGFVQDEDLVFLYNLATAFIMPSLYEGFGLPVVEAMKCGAPVISTKNGSLAEIIGEAALVIDGESSDNIAHAIKRVFSDTALQKDLSRKGLEQVKKFSWEKTARETIDVYKRVL